MRALTLTQPWAGLVASGIKLIENRPRHMIKSADFGKRFAIHASREIKQDVYLSIAACDPSLKLAPDGADQDPRWYPLSRITSAVIATAVLRDALFIGGNHAATTRIMLAKLGLADQERWTFGPTCYVLSDVRSLDIPVPCRGHQGFWTLNPAAAAAVSQQLHEAA